MIDKENKKTHNQYLEVGDETYDFGFSFTNEDDLITANPIYSSIEDEVNDLKNRLRAVQKIFLPLLENLNTETNKPMINWPDRKEVLDNKISKMKMLTNV